MKLSKRQLKRIIRESINDVNLEDLPFESTENFYVSVQAECVIYIEHSDEGVREMLELRVEDISELIEALHSLQNKLWPYTN